MAKRSRRDRRLESNKSPRTTPQPRPATAATPVTEAKASPVSEAPLIEAAPTRKMVDFAREYFYVFQELQTIAIVAVVMFIVLIGLSYII